MRQSRSGPCIQGKSVGHSMTRKSRRRPLRCQCCCRRAPLLRVPFPLRCSLRTYKHTQRQHRPSCQCHSLYFAPWGLLNPHSDNTGPRTSALSLEKFHMVGRMHPTHHCHLFDYWTFIAPRCLTHMGTHVVKENHFASNFSCNSLFSSAGFALPFDSFISCLKPHTIF